MTRTRDPFEAFAISKKSQLITKSDQWLDDVRFLHQEGHFAAALYLGGFVIECLLKAALWARRSEQQIRTLLGRSHDLDELLCGNAGLSQEIQAEGHIHEMFVRLTSWTVKVRYNPRRPTRPDAEAFMLRLKEVRLWLRSRV